MEYKAVGCGARRENIFPWELMQAWHIRFPEAHREAGEMARLALHLREREEAAWCTLPHCSTVEAQALGAKICLGDGKAGPRASELVVRHVGGLRQLGGFDLQRGRIAQVLRAAARLTEGGFPVVLNVEGAFTILDYLMPSRLTYRALAGRDPDLMDFLDRLRGELLGYLQEAKICGVRLISFADPTGNPALVGERFFADMAECFTLPLLHDVAAGDAPALHLCPQLFHALVKESGITVCRTGHSNDVSYGEALMDESRFGGPVLLGGGCIHQWNRPVGEQPLHTLSVGIV